MSRWFDNDGGQAARERHREQDQRDRMEKHLADIARASDPGMSSEELRAEYQVAKEKAGDVRRFRHDAILYGLDAEWLALETEIKRDVLIAAGSSKVGPLEVHPGNAQFVHAAIETGFAPQLCKRKQDLRALLPRLSPRGLDPFADLSVTYMLRDRLQTLALPTVSTGDRAENLLSNIALIQEAIKAVGEFDKVLWLGLGALICIETRKNEYVLAKSFPSALARWRTLMTHIYAFYTAAAYLSDTVRRTRYSVIGIDKKTGSETVITIDGISDQAVRVMADLKGVAVVEIHAIESPPAAWAPLPTADSVAPKLTICNISPNSHVAIKYFGLQEGDVVIAVGDQNLLDLKKDDLSGAGQMIVNAYETGKTLFVERGSSYLTLPSPIGNVDASPIPAHAAPLPPALPEWYYIRDGQQLGAGKQIRFTQATRRSDSLSCRFSVEARNERLGARNNGSRTAIEDVKNGGLINVTSTNLSPGPQPKSRPRRIR